MTRTEQEKYRQRLMDLGRRLQGDFAYVSREAFRQEAGDSAGNISTAPLHPADLASDTFEHEVSLGILENQDQILEQIVAALGRLDAGTFGSCTECGKKIPKERLDAVPYAAHCIQCATIVQAGGNPSAT